MAADVDALLQAPTDATPGQLSGAAFARGLHLAPSAAERFVETITLDEAARSMLEAAGLRPLQQELRKRVPPPAVTEGTLPQPGTTVGGDALLGPQPGMGMVEVEAAALEQLEEEQADDDDDDDGGGGGGGGGEGGGGSDDGDSDAAFEASLVGLDPAECRKRKRRRYQAAHKRRRRKERGGLPDDKSKGDGGRGQRRRASAQ